MNEDFIRQLGYANLDTRLKRISDKMIHSLRSMYKTLDIDVEPSWYLVLLLVNEYPNSSVMEIATRLQFTHQSIDTMTNKMVASGYLIKVKDTVDKRKTIFNLTEKARNNLPLFTKIWEIGKEVIFELLNQDTIIMEHLDGLESNLKESSFGDRIKEKLNA
ncbi:MarR family winged helix-turn-helix transcriptional regulator [Yeosuana sp.]|uniref:MarR family winged helix-turn-helix transcriptional regulator n=1 Tax=Yeosuana sp. TaxID=2529388 RepID=UPI004054F46E